MRPLTVAFAASLWLFGQAPIPTGRPVAALSPYIDVHAHLAPVLEGSEDFSWNARLGPEQLFMARGSKIFARFTGQADWRVAADFAATNVASITRLADADTHGHEWKIIGTGGYDFDLGGMKLKPFIGIDYTKGKLDGFVETGAGAADLTVDSIKADRTDGMIGVDLQANPHTQISPSGISDSSSTNTAPSCSSRRTTCSLWTIWWRT